MRNQISIVFLLQLLLFSCSCSISTAEKEYTINPFSQLKSDWKINSKEWILKKDTISGTGSLSEWGVLESKRKLPKNYEIEFKTNMTQASLFEVMLNLEKGNYIRTYLYQIDQNIVIGKGIYDKNSNEYDKRGGKSLFTKSLKLENYKWYSVKIRVQNSQLYFSVNNKTVLECSLEKSNLSKKGKLGFLTNGETKIIDLTIKSIE